ncbi:MAG TPA: hypothetical protein VKR29_03035, partial [Candidatus Binataceae bacterium]|nr:hypothetical protein [Candidatus Binataceae bacterium]
MLSNQLFLLYRHYSRNIVILVAAVSSLFLGGFSASSPSPGRIEAVRLKAAATPSALPNGIAEPPAYKATT